MPVIYDNFQPWEQTNLRYVEQFKRNLFLGILYMVSSCLGSFPSCFGQMLICLVGKITVPFVLRLILALLRTVTFSEPCPNLVQVHRNFSTARQSLNGRKRQERPNLRPLAILTV